MKRIYLLFTFAALLCACGEKPGPDPAPGPEDEKWVPEDITSLTVYGRVLDENGKPYEGVVMSDEYNFAVTDSEGKYRFEKYRYASFVQCSIPADAVIDRGGSYNLPVCHFKKLVSGTKEYNFTFTRQEKEKRFRILALGDPQMKNNKEVGYFRQTTTADIEQYVKDAEKLPTYGITLGDNVENAWDFLPTVARELGALAVPVFATIGNHDHEFPTENDAAARRRHEETFGPSNYSFNRGDVHFIVMDNVLFGGSAVGDYNQGYEEWQKEWLKKDLSFVPKDKSLFVTMHIPLKNKEIMGILAPYKSVQVVCGHTHKVENTAYNTTIDGKRVYICAGGSTGAPWKGLILSDGCPRGYKVYEFDGTDIKREVYKGHQFPESFQMRMYRTNDFPKYTTKTGNVFAFPFYGDDYIAVNVFNYKSDWKISLWEDGVETVTYPTQKKSQDVWARIFMYEVKGVDTDEGENNHMFYFRRKNMAATSVKVTVTDDFGATFTCDQFTTSADVPDYK